MENRQPTDRFVMFKPGEVRNRGHYGFWLRTEDQRLLAVVRSMNCVADMKRHRPSGRVLVEISDDHDPDEAWHWIRTELEGAIHEVELDPIWINALKWIL